MNSCPKCKSVNIMYSKKRNLYICEDCGNCFNEKLETKKIFFSYGHDNNAVFVMRIKQDLEKLGYSVWIDKSNIKAGEEWRAKITLGIIEAQGVILFLSKHSVRDPGVCLDEIRIALTENHGNIRTVLLEPEKEVSPPGSLSDIQWLDMSEWVTYAYGSAEWEQWYASKFKQLLEIINTDDFQSFKGEIEDIDKYLLPTICDLKEISLLKKDFIGRKWLISLLENWRLNNLESRAFILYGESGSGKSCFMANQIHYNTNVVCGVFCEWNKIGNNPANTVTRTIAHKLATKLPDYRKLLLKRLKIYAEKLDSMSCKELFDFLILQPLSSIIDGGRERKLLLIDGLDEAEYRGRNEFAQVLADSIDRFPKWISLVITSRPESEIVSIFARFKPYTIETKGADNTSDVHRYLIGSFEKMQISLSKEKYDEMIEVLDNKCHGNFLYASLLIEAISQGDLDIYDFEAYPSSIDSFYEQNFRRKYGNNENNFSKMRDILELIVAENRLPSSIICQILGISYAELNRKIMSLGSMINIEQAYIAGISEPIITYSFAHKSFAEWLTDYKKNYAYFIDKCAGVRKLLNYYKKVLVKELIPIESICSIYDYNNYFVQTHIINAYIYLGQWNDLEKFLLENDTPLFPYWCCVNLFPATWEKSKLVDRLWHDINLEEFFEMQQRRSERKFVEAVVGWMIERFGMDKLKTKVFNIYTDMIHIGGNYPKAVSLYADFLNNFTKEEIVKNKDYLMMAIRKIHNSMFFLPVQGLIEEAKELEKNVSQKFFKKEYNELIFLLGGNLAILNGDMALAEEYVNKSYKFALENSLADYEVRSARKIIDLFCYKKDYLQALNFSKKYISLDANIESRYEIYLLGALGEIYRHLEDYEQSDSCFKMMRRVAYERGITGWIAHAMLGEAAIRIEKGRFNRAKEILEEAKKIYNSINQLWGQINAGIIELLLDKESCESKNLYRDLLCLSKKMQYGYCKQCLNNIKNMTIKEFHLYFL